MNYPVIFLLMFVSILVLGGCGVKITEEEECVPSVSFVSTEKVHFSIVDIDDRSYSVIRPDQGEQFLCVNDPFDGRSCKDFNQDYFPKAITTPLPEGSTLTLTGKMKRTSPWGLMTAFKGELIYLQGVIAGRTVWATETDLRVISGYAEGAEHNLQSFRATKLSEDDSGFGNWQCPGR